MPEIDARTPIPRRGLKQKGGSVRPLVTFFSDLPNGVIDARTPWRSTEHMSLQKRKKPAMNVMMYLTLWIVLAGSLSTLAIASDYYKLSGIKRLDQDLYRSGKLLIETRYCYHYTYGEDAVLKYEGTGDYSGSKIIWEDDSTCEVKKVVSD